MRYTISSSTEMIESDGFLDSETDFGSTWQFLDGAFKEHVDLADVEWTLLEDCGKDTYTAEDGVPINRTDWELKNGMPFGSRRPDRLVAPSGIDTGPQKVWMWANQCREPIDLPDFTWLQKQPLRHWGYVIWDRHTLDDFQVPWDEQYDISGRDVSGRIMDEEEEVQNEITNLEKKLVDEGVIQYW